MSFALNRLPGSFFAAAAGPIDPETVISKNPSPSDEGTNSESGFDFDFDGRRVDGVDVNQLNVVIGISVVAVVVV
jgi:hypothetical protein